MKRLNLLNVDLNLMVAFDALVIEGNVTRAAARVGISQPAMSRSLRHLRELFGDELFARKSDGMVPTPRAIELARQIRPSLESIAAALGERVEFDPAEATRRFVFAMPDMAATVVLPNILKLVQERAPLVEISVVNAGNSESISRVMNGQAEFGFGVYEYLPPKVGSHNLMPLKEICIADPANPVLARHGMSMETFLQLPHIAISMDRDRDRGIPVETLLNTMGVQRHIALTTPFFDSVPRLVLGTPLVAIVVERLLDQLAEAQCVARYEIPFQTTTLMAKLIWHQRAEEDPGHIWMRNLIAEAAELQ